MFAKIKAVISNAAKTVLRTAISAKKSITPVLKLLCRVTARFFKVNIVETLGLTVKAVKIVKSFFAKGFAAGGFKQAIMSVVRKISQVKTDNPASFKKLAIMASASGLVVCCLLTALVSNFNTVAVSVITNGQIVGYVSDSGELDEIMSGVSQMILNEEELANVDTIKFGLAVVPKSSVKNGEDLALSVLNAQDNFGAAVGLYVNDEFVTCASSEQVIKEALELRKDEYVTEYTTSVTILEDVNIKTVYCSADTEISDKKATSIISDDEKLLLNIQTTNMITTTKPIEYDVVTKEDANKVVGYNRISVLGKDGTVAVEQMITSVNGQSVQTLIVDEKVVEEPVNQIIVKGTSTNGMSTIQKTLTSKGISFLWPIAATDDMYISSAWGDGRGHKGLDITGDYGTDIYASYDGTVAYAGWSGEYGYLIVINHKGGYQTAYAHMSSIYVKAGDIVKTGDVIAGCGSTGIATGEHVHFEVRIGGTSVNPAPYLGIGY